MKVEIKELHAITGTSEEIKALDKDSIAGALGDVVLYVSDRLESAMKSGSSVFDDLKMPQLITMAVSNIIINMILPRLSSENKDRRLLVMNRFLDELKDITLELFEQAEKTDLSIKQKH